MSRSLSPLTPGSAKKPPHKMLMRSNTAPLPSPEIVFPQDCAFPIFPSTSRPGSPSESKVPSHNDGLEFYPRNGSVSAQSGASLGEDRGRRFLQRMDGIAPGPFNIGGGRDGSSVSRHEWTATAGTGTDTLRQSGSSSSSSYSHRRPSVASAKHGTKLSLSSISGGPRSNINHEAFDTSSLPAGPPPSRPRRPSEADDRSQAPRYQFEDDDDASQPYSTQSQTFPSQDHRTSRPLSRTQRRIQKVRESQEARETHEKHARRPSEPTTRRPTIAAANRPLWEIGSTNSYKASRSMSTSSRAPSPKRADSALGHNRNASRNGSRTDHRLEAAPPVPLPKDLQDEFGPANPYHTPNISTSSNESAISDTRTGSSRSSPPTSDVSPRSKRLPADPSRVDQTTKDLQAAMSTITTKEVFKTEARRAPPRDFSRPTYATEAARTELSVQIPQPAAETTLSNGYYTPDTPSNNHSRQQRPHADVKLPPPQMSASTASYLPTPPPEDYTPMSSSSKSASAWNANTAPARRATTANKGNCRGCNEPIKGKSVSSADGRLTGRYHKTCFVCHTCREAFQTADFYVLDNHPYCARHYHSLNGSLCTTCDRGIEGQYLETEVKQKFHPHCFSCTTCRRILKDEYFELSGKPYCENHAHQVSQQPGSLLAPGGRRHPERRTTKLMMMMM